MIQQEADHTLVAKPDTVHWVHFDRNLKPSLTVKSGQVISVGTVTPQAGDAPELLMDEGTEVIFNAIPEDKRKPGPHLLTGPIYVEEAQPGDMLEVQMLDLSPRMPYGVNVIAPWGFLKEYKNNNRVTAYELSSDNQWLMPKFHYDYPGFYKGKGKVIPPDKVKRIPAETNRKIPARLHAGAIGVAPE